MYIVAAGEPSKHDIFLSMCAQNKNSLRPDHSFCDKYKIYLCVFTRLLLI